MFFCERLGEGHDCATFSCGNVALDRWLAEAAASAMRSRSARTWVWIDEAGAVAAYYSLAPHSVVREEMPSKVGRGSPRVIPAILLAKLALGEQWQGHGLGAVLLADALSTAVEAMRSIGGRLIVVDAIDDAAAAFYEHHGFAKATANRLVMKASSAASSLGVDWP